MEKFERKYKRVGFWKRLWINSPFVTSLAINIESISNIHSGGVKLIPRDVIDLYVKTKTLFYIGDRPIVLKNGWFSRTRIIDVEEMTDDERVKAIELLKGKKQ